MNGPTAMLDSLAGALSSRLTLVLAIIMAIATLAVLPLYPGRAVVLLTFGAAVVGLAIAGCVASQSVFCRLLAIFLCLGFWAKLVVHLLGVGLIEPTGAFDGSPEAWDRVLLVATVAIGAAAVAVALCSMYDGFGALATENANVPLDARLAIPIFVISATLAVALFCVNRWYAILTIGFVPRIALDSYVYLAISFIVSWGAILWLGTLAYWLVRQGRWPVDSLFYLAAIEGALATMSMASRAQMFLHVLAVVMLYVLWRRRLQWQIPLHRWIAIAGVAAALFAGSLAVVSVDRVLAFATAAPLPPAPAPTATSPRPLPRAAAPTTPGAAPLPPGDTVESRAGTPPSLAPRTDARSFVLKLKHVQHELSRLVVMRWLGLEGVMAMTAADGLGLPLFREMLYERPEAGNDAIFQRISNSQYERLRDFVFLTLPGPITVLASSDSFLVVALGMMLLVFWGYLIERFADVWTANPVASSVVGCALAFLVANMNFPRTLFFFSLTLVGALMLIGFFRMGAQLLSERQEPYPG
jgi:hypothetical protein